eukprot:scaffold30271_cov33-Prasinocladus_malaysianus.AAC.1
MNDILDKDDSVQLLGAFNIALIHFIILSANTSNCGVQMTTPLIESTIDHHLKTSASYNFGHSYLAGALTPGLETLTEAARRKLPLFEIIHFLARYTRRIRTVAISGEYLPKHHLEILMSGRDARH